MSKESVKKFVKDVKNKPEIKTIIDKAKSDFDSKEAKIEYIAKEAKKYGYSFTADELKTFIKQQSKNLSDDDLENVAGGFGISLGFGINF